MATAINKDVFFNDRLEEVYSITTMRMGIALETHTVDSGSITYLESKLNKKQSTKDIVAYYYNKR